MNVLILSINREKFPDPVFPLGSSYIADSLIKAGYSVEIFDCCFRDDPVDSLTTYLKEKPFDIIGISIRNVDNNSFPIATNYLSYYKEVVQTIRNNTSAKIVLGGSGYSLFSDLYFEELKPDFAVKGEGELEFISLIKEIETGEIPEIRIRHGRTIKDIDYKDFPLRKGYDIDNYYKYSGCINIQSKRGCIYNCSYCTYPVLEGNTLRFRTPSKVADEIEYWHNEKGVKHFFFVDNVFNMVEKKAFELCEEIIKRKIDIKWTGFFIPTLKSPEFILACKESGLSSVDFGTDAFSKTTLEGFNKFFTIDDIFRSCDICRDEKIVFNHSMIFGGPNETFETLEETITNLEATNPNSVIGFIGVRVYPGTDIAKLVSKDMDIGIEPVFYVSEAVGDTLVQYLKKRIGRKRNWIIPGLEKGTDLKFIKWLRDKGAKGPLWEGYSNMPL